MSSNVHLEAPKTQRVGATDDKLGRLTKGGTRSYGWNIADQLETVSNTDGSRVENRFDSKGIRRFRTETDANGTASTVLFISPWSEVRDGKLQRYIVHGGRRVARLAADNGTSAVAAGPAEKLTANSDGGSIASWKLPAWILATGQLLFAPLLLLVLGWHYRKRLIWPARLVLTGVALLLASACSGDAPKSSGELPPEGSVKQLTATDKLIFSDQLGSVLAETNGIGEVTGRFASYPFGVSRYDTSAETQRYATGIRDAGAGLDLMGARFYSHALGFWTSGAPVAVDEPERYVGAEFGAANPYAYANLTPSVAVDKDGEFWHIVAGAVVGAALGGGIEAARQYISTGKVEDWGRVGAAAGGGFIAGGIIAACPAAGLGAALGIGAVSNTAAGLAERAIVSGGKDLGTAQDVIIDASVGAVTGVAARGLTKVITKLRPAKPAMVLDSEKAFQRQYRQLQAGGGGAKRGPKTDPNAPHNATIRGQADALEAEGNTIIAGGGRSKERLIPTPGGAKGGRRPDILYETPGGEMRGRNVGKVNAQGQPIPREQSALDDLNGPGGLPTDFAPYNKK